MNVLYQSNKKLIIQDSLPHNFLAEKMVLSYIITNTEAIEIVRQNLIINAFYFKNHQKLYQALLQMYDKNLPIDIVTLAIFLQDKGLIHQIGGIKVLIEFGNQGLTSKYLNEYIRIIKEKFLKRCLIRFGYKIINAGYITNISFENSLSKIEAELFNLTRELEADQIISTAQILNILFSELKIKVLNPELSGLTSGFRQLDELTQGFQKSDLIIIAGRPSMGKTVLSLNMALNCIKSTRLPVLFCSLEMSKEQILYRLLSSETTINQMKLRSGKLTQNDWIKLNKVIRILSKLPFFIDDTPTLSTQDIRRQIKRIILEQNQLGLVIIDYIQLMNSLTDFKNNRVQQLAQITRELKGLAREFNIPIIALSQLSRNVDNRSNYRPILSDLRESGAIEQDADLILMLSRLNINMSSLSKPSQISGDTTKESSLIELIIAKQRNGPTGTIQLKLNKNKLQFIEL